MQLLLVCFVHFHDFRRGIPWRCFLSLLLTLKIMIFCRETETGTDDHGEDSDG